VFTDLSPLKPSQNSYTETRDQKPKKLLAGTCSRAMCMLKRRSIYNMHRSSNENGSWLVDRDYPSLSV